jgi:2-succinyl-5-enolpyruvyl-6-hydroxy-3-cyclohexene-1-carboxylate synthase
MTSILTPPTDTHVLLRAFVDELARCGMQAACTSPGSRSTPLVLALARDRRLRCFSHIDERAAGFFALGLAKATGNPVALACTSGTAAAHYAPAVIEAHEARVPLVVLTADRPPELREVGAGQTIDQIKLYGSAAKWFFEVGTHEATPERLRWMRSLACRAYWTALEGRPGPVHLNFPLREPLVADPDELPPDDSGRPGGRPFVARIGSQGHLAPDSLRGVADVIAGAPRGVVVLGREERTPDLARTVAAFGKATGFPVLADPLSGGRTGPAAIAHYDALLADERFAAVHRPQLVLRVGDLPTSKPLRRWLAGLDATQVAFDPEGAWQDPDSVLDLVLGLDPLSSLNALGALAQENPDPSWLQSWRASDAAAAEAIAATLGDELSEPRLAAELGAILPAGALLWVASSMPVRDVEAFFPVRPDPPRLLSHRGANGIDGTLAGAAGAAAAAKAPVVALIGDVAFAHDIGGLLAAARLGIPMTVVVVDNRGGGIFDMLPVAGQRDIFEEHIATPPGLEIARAAALAGATHVPVASLDELHAALVAADGLTIVEVRTDRARQLELRRACRAAVSAALARR